ncbi:enoyl-CoA hydratase/isomerase family protein [Paraburkholderia sp. CNPSo 3281]|uniref:enoyl-CoA hydratase/isomerase family protein n=1 Tax=Paraburkholderia sp. CNPSo 3281 TaxID=2940933 RepID=UPI0020B64C94|nr:enoyl-CoA hydratase/isomerase family protein [Paraburkholderia sp. CNPSo 3281]MCP3721089.1 enoyl-CoA hydratase/isomerase family protein [Paraburkholderia sp. CNPSo 3281]
MLPVFASRELTDAPAVLFRVVNRVAIISLNRSDSLNVLSYDTVLVISALLKRCRADSDIVAVILRSSEGRAFCAGTNVVSLYESVVARNSKWKTFIVDEYRLNYALHAFPKPVITLLDGATFGSGMSLSQGAWLRIVTERAKLTMTETRIGLVPNMGTSYFLKKTRVDSALYLALTGATLSAPGAIYMGLADLCVSSQSLLTLEDRLRKIPSSKLDPMFPDVMLKTLRALFEELDTGVVPETYVPHHALEPVMTYMRLIFASRNSIEDIMSALGRAVVSEQDQVVRTWLSDTREALLKRAPTMLYVAREMIIRGRQSSLRECLRRELGVITRCLEDGDFMEGVRAFMIDKDNQPKWAPHSLWEVREDRVQHYLRSPWDSTNHLFNDVEAHYP